MKRTSKGGEKGSSNKERSNVRSLQQKLLRQAKKSGRDDEGGRGGVEI